MNIDQIKESWKDEIAQARVAFEEARDRLEYAEKRLAAAERDAIDKNMPVIQAHILSFLNGNVEESKKSLQQYSRAQLISHYIHVAHSGHEKACLFALYIKGENGAYWQEYCDADF